MRKKIENLWKRSGGHYLTACLLQLVAGILFLLVPYDWMDEVFLLISFFLIGGGIFVVIEGIVAKKKVSDLTFGIFLAVIGLCISVSSGLLVAHAYLLVGCIVLLGGFLDLYHYVKIRYTYGEPELLTIGLSSLSAILGLCILLHPFPNEAHMFRLVGVAFLFRSFLCFLYYKRLLELN